MRLLRYTILIGLVVLSGAIVSASDNSIANESMERESDTPPKASDPDKDVLRKLHASEDLDTFLDWLREQPGVQRVRVDRDLYLTTSPPQIAIFYLRNGMPKKLRVHVESERKLKFAKPR